VPSVSITWHAIGDVRTCPICKAINGYVFGPYEGEPPDSLIHPEYGEVWNKITGSLAHEHKQFGKKYGLLSNCRCHITIKPEFQDLLFLLQKAIDALTKETTEAFDYQKGDSRKTSFEDIGVDPSKYGWEET
jgi:hypothetical protein